MQSLHEVMPNLNPPFLHESMRIRRRKWLLAAMVVPMVGTPLARAQPAKAAASSPAPVTLPGQYAPVRVHAASDLKFALADIASLYEKQTGVSIVTNLGSSGNLSRQIAQGLPGDIFMSADEAFATALVASGHAQGPGVSYGLGRIALLFSAPSAPSQPPTASTLGAHAATPQTLAALAAQIRRLLAGPDKFAIANPDHAPYGRAAREALQALNLWDAAQPHLVLGENVAQATQFVTTGAAVAGITAWPLALPLLKAASAKRTPAPAPTLQALLLPSQLHQPLRQHMVLLKNASPSAERFFGFLQSPPAREALLRFGFGSTEQPGKK